MPMLLTPRTNATYLCAIDVIYLLSLIAEALHGSIEGNITWLLFFIPVGGDFKHCGGSNWGIWGIINFNPKLL
jgi:hypothetical protein